MTTTMDIRQPLQVMATAILTLVLWVLGIVWHIVKEIINGVYRMAIGFIVLLVSVVGFIGLILWLLTLWKRRAGLTPSGTRDLTPRAK